jgi:glycosyltransferase involved in cell wall biosynthesis
MSSPNFVRIMLTDAIEMPCSYGSEVLSPSFCRKMFQERFDIVILPLGSVTSIFYSLLAKCAGIKPIWHITVHTLPRSLVGFLRGLIIRTSMIVSNQVITLTSMHRRMLLSMGFPVDRITVIPHSVAVNGPRQITTNDQLKTRLGLSDRHIIVYVGRLAEEKGLHYLIDAMRLVVLKDRKAFLLVIGEGPLRKAILEQIRELKLDSFVKIMGPVQPSEVPGYLSICEIHVAPSVATKKSVEPFGLVYLEAMASAKPSIAFAISAPVMMIIENGHTGYLVKERSVVQLADRICHLLLDDEERTEMGKRAFQRCVNEYSLESVAQMWYDSLQSVRTPFRVKK